MFGSNIQDLQPYLEIFGAGFVTLVVAFAITPLWTNFLYKHKLGKQIRQGNTPIFTKMHKDKKGTPTMGGVIIWLSVFVVALLGYLFSKTGSSFFEHYNFLTRQQTLLPLAALIATAFIGLLDDYLNVKKIGPLGGGLRVRHRLILYTMIAIVGAWWFYSKLGWDILHVPGVGDFHMGLWYIPFFILVIVATSHSVNITDGLDGLVGGVLMAAFAAYGAIAFVQHKTDLAAFCAAIIGALIAFLWFNVHPARFFMGDTGSMALGTTLGIVAMLTNSALVLPLIAIIPVIESGSVLLQIVSKKTRGGKKIFLSTPIHHHFEAKGWPETKVTMRFWIIASIFAVLGLIIGVIGRGNS